MKQTLMTAQDQLREMAYSEDRRAEQQRGSLYHEKLHRDRAALLRAVAEILEEPRVDHKQLRGLSMKANHIRCMDSMCGMPDYPLCPVCDLQKSIAALQGAEK